MHVINSGDWVEDEYKLDIKQILAKVRKQKAEAAAKRAIEAGEGAHKRA